jgi:hypothetical protein
MIVYYQRVAWGIHHQVENLVGSREDGVLRDRTQSLRFPSSEIATDKT